MGARFYDSELGRWTSPDTIIPDSTNPQSLNRYSYGYNNPVKFRDPSGHQGEPVGQALEWATGISVAGGGIALTVDLSVVAVPGSIIIGCVVYGVGMYYGVEWVINGPLGPSYPLPEEYDPFGIGATYVLPEASTLTVETNWLLAKSGAQIAAHLAMIYGEASVGGVPGHPGDPDPDRRDLNKNVKDLRNSLRNEFRNMR